MGASIDNTMSSETGGTDPIAADSGSAAKSRIGLRGRVFGRRFAARDAYLVIVVLIAVGTPGLLKLGAPGATFAEVGLINVSSLARIGLYLAAAYLMAVVYLASRASQAVGVERPANSLAGLRLVVAIFAWYLVSAAFVVEGFALLPLYRVGEWALLVLAIAAATPAEAYLSRERAERQVATTLMAILSLPLVAVLAGLAIVPDMAVVPGGEYTRLGGWLYNPNGLGTACGMGSVSFWMLTRSWAGKAWAAVLFVCMILTYSRGALIGFGAAAFVGLGLYAWRGRPGGRVAALAAIVLALPSLVWAYAQGLLLDLLSRGETVEALLTLNMRTVIWHVAWESSLDHWMLGRGFIVGPKALADHFHLTPWFQPSTAHNDFLNAFLAGGVVAVGLLVGFYVLLVRGLLVAPLGRTSQIAFAMIATQAGCYAIVTPLLSGTVNAAAATLLILLRHMAQLRRTQVSASRLPPDVQGASIESTNSHRAGTFTRRALRHDRGQDAFPPQGIGGATTAMAGKATVASSVDVSSSERRSLIHAGS